MAAAEADSADIAALEEAADGDDAAKRQYILSASGDLADLRAPEGVTLVDSRGGIALIELSKAADLAEVTEALAEQYPDLLLQPNFIYESTSTGDPCYSLQWGLSNSSGADIGFDAAYRFLRGKKASLVETVVA